MFFFPIVFTLFYFTKSEDPLPSCGQGLFRHEDSTCAKCSSFCEKFNGETPESCKIICNKPSTIPIANFTNTTPESTSKKSGNIIDISTTAKHEDTNKSDKTKLIAVIIVVVIIVIGLVLVCIIVVCKKKRRQQRGLPINKHSDNLTDDSVKFTNGNSNNHNKNSYDDNKDIEENPFIPTSFPPVNVSYKKSSNSNQIIDDNEVEILIKRNIPSDSKIDTENDNDMHENPLIFTSILPPVNVSNHDKSSNFNQINNDNEIEILIQENIPSDSKIDTENDNDECCSGQVTEILNPPNLDSNKTKENLL